MQKIALEIDLEQMPTSDDKDNGEIVRREREPLKPVYDPMRRKLHVSPSL